MNSFKDDFMMLSLHRKVYMIGLIIAIIGLPLSNFLMSISQLVLIINWLIEGDFKAKYHRFQNNKIGKIILLLPLVYLLWVLKTSDFFTALNDIKIKLPFIVFTIVIGSIEPITKKELQLLFNTFLLAVFASTIVGLAIYTGVYKVEVKDFRSLSHYISHIIFSLMLVMSILIIVYRLYANYNRYNKTHIVLNLILVGWFMFFLAIIQSITGWISFFVLVLFTFVKYYKTIKNRLIKNIVLLIFLLVLFLPAGVVYKVISDFYFVPSDNIKNLPTHTPYGNVYKNDTTSILKENGHRIKILICETELEQSWDSVSNINYVNGKDAKGYPIKSTLIRFLTSKGVAKDRDGVLSLSKKEINLIESGYPNIIYLKYRNTPYIRIYRAVWDIDRYYKTGDPNNKSIAQRIEFYRAAFYIIKNNFWLGVGSGDIKKAFAIAYTNTQSRLKKDKRFTVHNQYISFFVSFGIVGGLIVVFSLLYPGIKYSKQRGVLLQGFMIIMFVSMLSDNILEVQAGVTFFALFYNLLIFNKAETTY